MKVVLVDSYALRHTTPEEQAFSENGIEFVAAQCHRQDEIVECCKDADVVLDIFTNISGEATRKMAKCKAMIRYGIGFDVFDLKAATEMGIMVCNVPDYCIPEVAAHASSMLLALSRQLMHFTLEVRSGIWEPRSGMPMRRPGTQTLGIIGFGNIGKMVTTYTKPFCEQIVAYDPYVAETIFLPFGVKKVELDKLLEISDMITVHVPLYEETRHMINRETIAKMKDGVIFVNTARGPVVCEEALVEALQSGKVGAAGLDVLDPEPFGHSDHPYYHMDNVLLSPHAAFNSSLSAVSLRQKVIEAALKAIKGELPFSVINKKELGL